MKRSFYVTDSKISAVSWSHDLHPLTRLQIRIANIDGVQKVDAPVFYIDMATNDFVWKYSVERKTTATWRSIVTALAAAHEDFFRTCAPSDYDAVVDFDVDTANLLTGIYGKFYRACTQSTIDWQSQEPTEDEPYILVGECGHFAVRLS
ncbi:MAG: hypothetical protein H6797_04500 [Candidatus Nomurabacteria bacterium]|nr:MAG: hypothetical protein H6797_04500 [Candidatus Nomurabacteria bacterium]